MDYDTRTYYEVDYSDLEREIKSRYGRTVELVPAEEWSNDADHTFRIPAFREVMTEGWREFLDTGKHRYGFTRLALSALCLDGHIPAGEWLVRVSW